MRLIRRLFSRKSKKYDARPTKIESTGQTEEILGIPIWFDALGSGAMPTTYEKVFWFVEPSGDYIYYLAGDYVFADNGFLAFGSATIEIRVEVSFEQDLLSVHKGDDWDAQSIAEKNSQTGRDLSGLTLGNVFHQLPENSAGLANVAILNESYRNFSPDRMARLEFEKLGNEPPKLRLIFQSLHKGNELEQPERLLTILVQSRDLDQNIGDLCTVLDSLISKFENLPYKVLPRALRM